MARSRQAQALISRGAGDEARAELSAAREAFRTVGAPRLVERAERLAGAADVRLDAP